jgi:hypothetical protein
MANSSLQGYSWNVPEELYNHLSRIMNAYKGDKNVSGYQRLRNILDTKKLTYENIKLIKNFFDTFGGSKNDTEFILNGGAKMKFWVNDTLNKAREGIKNPKDAMMKVGMGNQHIKTHTKNGISTDNVKMKKQKVGSSARKVSDNRGVTEITKMLSLLNIITENQNEINKIGV